MGDNLDLDLAAVLKTFDQGQPTQPPGGAALPPPEQGPSLQDASLLDPPLDAAIPQDPADVLQKTDPAALQGTLVTPKRRGPGRPSKGPAAPRICYFGVVDTPKFPESLLELGSDKPDAFKKLFTFLSKLKVEEIYMHCTPELVEFFASDSSDLLRVRVEVQGERMNHYYCKNEFWLRLSQEDMMKPFGAISKNCFHLVKLSYKETDPTVLNIILSDKVHHKENLFPTTASPVLSEQKWMTLTQCFNEREDYKVSWTVSQTLFKKSHEIAVQTARTIKIQLIGGGPLTLRYMGTGIQDFSEIYRDGQKIELESKLASGELFEIEYSATGAKTLSTTSQADQVTIYCTDFKPLLFVSADTTAGISVLTAMEPIKWES